MLQVFFQTRTIHHSSRAADRRPHGCVRRGSRGPLHPAAWKHSRPDLSTSVVGAARYRPEIVAFHATDAGDITIMQSAHGIHAHIALHKAVAVRYICLIETAPRLATGTRGKVSLRKRRHRTERFWKKFRGCALLLLPARLDMIGGTPPPSRRSSQMTPAGSSPSGRYCFQPSPPLERPAPQGTILLFGDRRTGLEEAAARSRSAARPAEKPLNAADDAFLCNICLTFE